MRIVSFLILLVITLSIISGMLFVIWKFTRLILEQRGIKHAKRIMLVVCIASALLIFIWLNSVLSGTRWLGC